MFVVFDVGSTVVRAISDICFVLVLNRFRFPPSNCHMQETPVWDFPALVTSGVVTRCLLVSVPIDVCVKVIVFVITVRYRLIVTHIDVRLPLVICPESQAQCSLS